MLNLVGEIDKDGKLFIHGKAKLKDFQKNNPNSKVTIVVEKLPILASAAMIYYYEIVMLPELQRGFKNIGQHMTIERIDKLLRNSFPCSVREHIVEGVFVKELPYIRELSKENMLHYMDFVRMYAHSNLHIHVAEPREIF